MTSLSWPDPLSTPVCTFTIILIDDDNDDIDDNDDNSDATRPQLLFFLCFRNQKYVTADFEFEVFKPSAMRIPLLRAKQNLLEILSSMNLLCSAQIKRRS